MRRRRHLIFAVAFIGIVALSAQATEEDPWEAAWQQAVDAAEKQEYALAAELADKAKAQGLSHAQVDYLVGRWHFRAGNFKQSLVRFDKYLENVPQRSNSLWERGITCYYTGDFKEGAKQFANYQKYHNNDVENAVWRFLCQAKFDGKATARQAILPIKNDRRVPMMEVYRLFKGELKPEQVITALAASTAETDQAKTEAMHAHLYLGLFHDAEGNGQAARKHLDLAVKQFKAGSYMWSVAVVHQKRLKENAREANK